MKAEVTELEVAKFTKIKCEAIDPGGDELIYIWDKIDQCPFVDGNENNQIEEQEDDENFFDESRLYFQNRLSGGTITGSGNEVLWTAPSKAGFYTAYCTVCDSKGSVDWLYEGIQVFELSIEETLKKLINNFFEALSE